jgi:hypothetical protein
MLAASDSKPEADEVDEDSADGPVDAETAQLEAWLSPDNCR